MPSSPVSVPSNFSGGLPLALQLRLTYCLYHPDFRLSSPPTPHFLIFLYNLSDELWMLRRDSEKRSRRRWRHARALGGWTVRSRKRRVFDGRTSPATVVKRVPTNCSPARRNYRTLLTRGREHSSWTTGRGGKERWTKAEMYVIEIDEHTPKCESGGTGRRARLRIWSRKGWGFESPLSHQTGRGNDGGSV
jgi:hypothetical protein